MLHKSFDIIETKADGESGTFEALVSVFGNIDRGGDRVMPGAFTKTLERWREAGDPVPVILSHQWSDPMAHVGTADPNDITETDDGLLVKGRLDVADNPVAAQVHRLMARRSLKEFSFGYEVAAGGEKKAKDGANELTDLDLVEVGPTLKGMNPDTELRGVKSALGVEDPPDEATLRKQSAQVERQIVEDRLPDPVEDPEPQEPEPDPVDELKAMVESLSARLDELAESVSKQAEVADKETKSRAVDPLRRRSERAVLEIQSDGLSERKPPKAKAPEPGPEPPSDRELRRQFERQTLELLTGAKQ